MIDDDEFEAPPPRRPLLRRKRVLIPLGALLAILVAFLLLRTPDTDRAAMIAKYGGAHAAFAAGPAGQRIHYRDQGARDGRSEEHTSELQSLMRISYAVFCLKKKKLYATKDH